MAEYFKNPEDLKAWVKSRGSYDVAAKELLDIIGNDEDFSEIPNDEQDIMDSCQAIFETEDEDPSKMLFGVLAKHNITQLNKQASNMKKESQQSTRQRNDWARNQRNKWNRTLDGHLDGTPWRVGRDEYYDFTHYATDEIRFDEDPQHVYSGEALWRTYVMDKFYRDYKDENGKVVGGYINDRFHVFPTAGTPANPNAPRDGGNQMELADGERTRKPRPHQYSTERRLEEARGNKTESIEIAADSFNKVVKIASNKNLEEASKDKVYNIFKDTIEMREAGIGYEKMIDAIADHYNVSIFSVAQIDKVAKKLSAKHDGVGYEINIKKAAMLSEMLDNATQNNIQITDPNGARGILAGGNQEILLAPGTVVVNVPNSPNVFEITDHPSDASLVGNRVTFANTDFEVGSQPYIQEAADELGLNEEQIQEVTDAVQADQANGNNEFGSNFAVTEM